MQSKQLILITGVERSGSTLISRVLQLCGANAGQTNNMRENKALRALNHKYIDLNSEACFMPSFNQQLLSSIWNDEVKNALRGQRLPDSMPFLFKDSGLAQLWQLWHSTYPNAKWIIVRRRTGDIIHSCTETGYMRRFKDADNLKLVGAETEQEGWLWWVHQYEERFREMVQANLQYRIVWPERMRDGDFDQMKSVVEWCNLEWNDDVISTMQTLLK